MIAEQEALPGLPHPGEVPGPFVHDFFTTALRHFYADPDSHPQVGGYRSLRDISAGLNDRGVRTPRGIGRWQAGSVAQLLARLSG
jgi:hypothetical protein